MTDGQVKNDLKKKQPQNPQCSIDWKLSYTMVNKMENMKLKWFQIKVLQRIFAANVVLKEMVLLLLVFFGFFFAHV